MKRGIIVGRFQPFHKGHLEIIKKILNEIDELVVIIGSSQYSHKLDNPFTAGERNTMIRNAIKEENIQLSKIWIVPVPDVHQHALWVAQIVGYSPNFDIVYSNEPLTSRLFIEAGFKVKSVPFIKRDVYSATKIRNHMINGGKWEEFVPNSVAKFIKEINGDARLLELNKTDKID